MPEMINAWTFVWSFAMFSRGNVLVHVHKNYVDEKFVPMLSSFSTLNSTHKYIQCWWVVSDLCWLNDRFFVFLV